MTDGVYVVVGAIPVLFYAPYFVAATVPVVDAFPWEMVTIFSSFGEKRSVFPGAVFGEEKPNGNTLFGFA